MAHTIFALLAIVLEFIGTSLYLWTSLRGSTRPHPFTWLGWSIINVIVAAAQWFSDAGPGAWVTAWVALVCVLTAVVAAYKGERKIYPSDWVFFGASFVAIVLWLITHDALAAVIIVTAADCLAFAPTIRKAYAKPDEENAVAYMFSTGRNFFALLSLQSFAVVNWLYPASILLSDGGFALLLLWRRRRLKSEEF